MTNLLSQIKNDLGNLTCPNCRKTATISIRGNNPKNLNVKMHIDCPEEQGHFCHFFNQLDNKLRNYMSKNPNINSFKRTDNQLRENQIKILPSRPLFQSANERLCGFGYVYLYQSGKYYKIGRTNNIKRREKEIKLQLPFEVKLIHYIETNFPKETEKHWHHRFLSKRKNGEWFCLTSSDVEEFKRITFM